MTLSDRIRALAAIGVDNATVTLTLDDLNEIIAAFDDSDTLRWRRKHAGVWQAVSISMCHCGHLKPLHVQGGRCVAIENHQPLDWWCGCPMFESADKNDVTPHGAQRDGGEGQ